MVIHLLDILFEIIETKGMLSFEDVRYAVNMEKQNNSESIKNYLNDILVTTYQGKPIRPKTIGQKRYVDIIRKNGVVFGVGRAGTGKTYLAMVMAIEAFKNKEVSRIILTRPAVEAGESLGFLPGDLQEKIDPYLRPLYDALFEIMGPETYQKLMEKGNIEVAPLAYMRGRTLDNSYVILDEAQNTTPQQMKMFLTRLGYGSKAIITGDITQLDLPNGKKSGLITIRNILKNVEGIEFVDLDKNDVVRHPLVQRIIDAYDKYEKRMNDANSDRQSK
ncbi:PhoH family protein [Helcococcus bovis]|uniref:PhoH-like protein n=1 Tax=Helcococcus bovis TaxID=3153252 RepID=A0ABW9F935_9FIRM